MKKQLTITLALLALSITFVGCTSNQSNQEVIESEETIISTENTLVEDESTEEAETTEETTEETLEDVTESTEEVADEITDQIGQAETETTKPSATPEATAKPQASASQSATTKPQASTKPSATTKPQASTGQSTNTKPQASTSQSTTTKPQSSTKPSATTKPQASTKPETTPTPSPVVPEKPSTDEASLSCNTIFNKISNGIDTSKMQDVDAQLLSDFYGIDSSLLEDFCVKLPMLSFSITEVGVFKVKDANNIDSVVSSINKRASDIGICLYPSLEETYANRQIVTKGQYILFVISDNADAIVSSFNALF